MVFMEKECQECIKLFGFDETRCAFCTDHTWYKLYLQETE